MTYLSAREMSWIMIRRAQQKDALIEDVEFVDAVAKVKIYLAVDKGLMKKEGGGSRGREARRKETDLAALSVQ